MFAFLGVLFGGAINFVKELVKTLIIDSIVGLILRPFTAV